MIVPSIQLNSLKGKLCSKYGMVTIAFFFTQLQKGSIYNHKFADSNVSEDEWMKDLDIARRHLTTSCRVNDPQYKLAEKSKPTGSCQGHKPETF